MEGQRSIVLALSGYAKLVLLGSAPVFENKKEIITKSGIIRLLYWVKNGKHHIEYALVYKNNQLSDDEKQTVLDELQKRMQKSLAARDLD